MPKCKICREKLNTASAVTTSWECVSCKAFVHDSCLERDDSPLLKGDRMFSFECKECSYEKIDVLTRVKLSWVQVVHLALYNLTINGYGRQGFFRWKEEICAFIEEHWIYFMPSRSKTSNWHCTVAGTMSLYCPKLFKSGTQLFKESGWWALKDTQPPPQVSNEEQMRAKYKPCKGGNIDNGDAHQDNIIENDIREQKSKPVRGKRGRKPREVDLGSGKGNHIDIGKVRKTTEKSSVKEELNIQSGSVKKEYVALKIETAELYEERESRQSPHLTSKGDFPLPSMEMDSDEVPIKQEPLDCSDNPIFDHDIDGTLGEFPDIDSYTFGDDPFTEDDNSPFTVSSLGDIIHSDDTSLNSLFPLDIPNHNEEKDNDEKPNISSDLLAALSVTPALTPCSSIGDSEQTTEPLTSSGGNVKAKSKSKRPKKPEKNLAPLGPKRELDLLVEINKCPELLESDPYLHRLRRKLLLRKTKREMGLPIFNLDQTVKDYLLKVVPDFKKSYLCTEEVAPETDDAVVPTLNSVNSYNHPALRDLNILDRFHLLNTKIASKSNKSNISFISRLMGDNSEPPPITSPYTSRVLKPYIRRDFESVPKKLAIANELFSRFKIPKSSVERHSIDYCYVQPNHIPALNAMCSNFFWPGIDLTECLQYPEFSCVVVYRKLLIGFAFMVPDVKFNEAYISFILVHPDWQRAGIGTFMMYHLVQTCMGKDITLHVSPSNPSMMLYQRLGFKAEQLILDFYDKYLPEGSRDCKHAFLLRLQR